MSTKEIFHKHFWRIFFAALLIALLILLSWFAFSIHNLYRSGMLRPTRGIHPSFPRSQLVTPASIQNWMIFEYINRTFNLPPDYLATSLKIQDPRYPNLGVGEYVKTKNLNDADFLKQVQDSVTQYLQGTH